MLVINVIFILAVCKTIEAFQISTATTYGRNDVTSTLQCRSNNCFVTSNRAPATSLRSEIDPSGGELTSTLARLDRQWQIEQKLAGSRSRWSKLILSQSSTTSSNSDPSSTIGETIPDLQSSNTDDFVYVLEPPNKSYPSCIIVFTGGAGLGTYPQIAYNELLLRVSNKLNAAVITAPYQVGLDHFTLAKETGDKARRAIIRCQEDPQRLYPQNLPLYSLSHSLGSKLSSIYIAATGLEYSGIGFISFNNFGFSQTIGMARSFADMISPGMSSKLESNEFINNIFNFAEAAVAAIGVEFSPKPSDMERLLAAKFDAECLEKVRLFTFDDDQLDSTQQFMNACCFTDRERRVSALPGTHLTPVYFKIGWDELTANSDITPDAVEMAKDAMGGFESASFGDETELSALVNEIYDWIKGKEPSRKPSWLRERSQLSGS